MQRPHAVLRRQDDTAAQSAAWSARRRVLTAVEFDVLWEWLELGPTPVVLRVASPGRTGRERAQIVAAGWQALRERGLAAHAGPDPELIGLLRLLAKPSRLVEVRIGLGGPTLGRGVRAAVASRRDTVAVAVRQDETITITPGTEVPHAVAAVFPELPPGPGRSITVPTADFEAAIPGAAIPRAAIAGAAGLAGPLVERGVPAADVALLDRMLRGATHRGQIGALAADGWGVLRRLPRTVGVLDAPRGRYLLTRSVAADGAPWTTIGPADGRRLQQAVGTLVADAQRLS